MPHPWTPPGMRTPKLPGQPFPVLNNFLHEEIPAGIPPLAQLELLFPAGQRCPNEEPHEEGKREKKGNINEKIIDQAGKSDKKEEGEQERSSGRVLLINSAFQR